MTKRQSVPRGEPAKQPPAEERQPEPRPNPETYKAGEGVPETKSSEGGRPSNVGSESARLAAALRKGDPDGDVLEAAARRIEELDVAAAFHVQRAERAERALAGKDKALSELAAR